jgi:sortase (surface protein transpeptidase)
VLEGHVDSASQGPSVFFRLGALTPGERIYVTRADHRTTAFTIDAVRRYSKDAFPQLLVYGNTVDAQLRLITCGGRFDSSTGHYRDNIVVFASLISVTSP